MRERERERGRQGERKVRRDRERERGKVKTTLMVMATTPWAMNSPQEMVPPQLCYACMHRDMYLCPLVPLLSTGWGASRRLMRARKPGKVRGRE